MSWMFSALMTLVLVGAVVYVVFRHRGDGGERDGRDAYYFVVMFLALAPLFWGVADLGRVWLEDALDVNSGRYYRHSAEDEVRALSLRVSTIVVALPIYAFHYLRANRREAGDYDWASRRAYTMGVLVMSTVIVLGAGTWLVYQGMNWALGVTSEDVKRQLVYALPYTLVAAGVWAWHIRSWRESEKGEIKV